MKIGTIYNMAANEELLDKQKEVPDILIPLLERILTLASMVYALRHIRFHSPTPGPLSLGAV